MRQAARIRPRLLVVALAITATAMALPSSAAANGVELEGIEWQASSPDGRHTYFGAWATLLEEDPGRSHQLGVYGYSTADGLDWHPLGPRDDENLTSNNSQVEAAADDGSFVVLTGGVASADDTDQTPDLFLVEDGQNTLITDFPVAPEGDLAAGESSDLPYFVGASDDLTTIYFSTGASLSADDLDDDTDIYRYSDGETTLVTGAPSQVPSASQPVYRTVVDYQQFQPQGRQVVSDDGSTLFFRTAERLLPSDQNSYPDVYYRRGEVLTLASPDLAGPGVDGGGYLGLVGAVNANERRVAFMTNDPHLEADDPGTFDWYLWDQDHLELLTPQLPEGTEYEDFKAIWGEILIAGGRVFFPSYADMVPEDTNGTYDLYQWASGELSIAALDSAGQQPSRHVGEFAASPDGSRLYVTSSAPLQGEDEDLEYDVYDMRDAAPHWRSLSSEGRNTREWVGGSVVSGDGRTVVLSTRGPLVPGDDDCVNREEPGCYDIYLNGPDGTRLVSGAYGVQGDVDNVTIKDVHGTEYPHTAFRAISADGGRVIFESKESLVPDDTSGRTDVYIWEDGRTRLVSAEGETQWWPTENLDDTRPPQTRIITPAVVAIPDVSFRFDSDEQGSSFECRLDAGDFEPCSSPKQYSGLAETEHTFTVRATDDVGLVDPVAATDSFTVDADPPQTTIERSPSDHPLRWEYVRFRIFGTKDYPTYECSLDGAPWETCGESVVMTEISEGNHTMRARAIDPAGVVDPTPAEVDFTFSDDPPETTIYEGPSGSTSQSSVFFSFVADQRNPSYECSLDGATFKTCTSPKSYGPLTEGPHEFRVRSTAYGRTEPTPASRTFTVNTLPPDEEPPSNAPPDTEIQSGPQSRTNDPSPEFGFSADLAGAGFECRIDEAQWSSCDSPHETQSLDEGSHRFAVRASYGGQTDSTPATREFVVDTVAPTAQIDSGPMGATRTPTPAFSFSTDDPDADARCAVDAAAFEPCTGHRTHRTGRLTEGPHTFRIRMSDGLNESGEARAFSVDTIAPQTSITRGPAADTSRHEVRFFFRASEAGASFRCRLDGAPARRCAAPFWIARLRQGVHTFEVAATDVAGNTDPSPATHTFRVRRGR
jgi:hypothetical protein